MFEDIEKEGVDYKKIQKYILFITKGSVFVTDSIFSEIRKKINDFQIHLEKDGQLCDYFLEILASIEKSNPDLSSSVLDPLHEKVSQLEANLDDLYTSFSNIIEKLDKLQKEAGEQIKHKEKIQALKQEILDEKTYKMEVELRAKLSKLEAKKSVEDYQKRRDELKFEIEKISEGVNTKFEEITKLSEEIYEIIGYFSAFIVKHYHIIDEYEKKFTMDKEFLEKNFFYKQDKTLKPLHNDYLYVINKTLDTKQLLTIYNYLLSLLADIGKTKSSDFPTRIQIMNKNYVRVKQLESVVNSLRKDLELFEDSNSDDDSKIRTILCGKLSLDSPIDKKVEGLIKGYSYAALVKAGFEAVVKSGSKSNIVLKEVERHGRNKILFYENKYDEKVYLDKNGYGWKLDLSHKDGPHFDIQKGDARIPKSMDQQEEIGKYFKDLKNIDHVNTSLWKNPKKQRIRIWVS
ncbi:MAG: hypothetical protein ACMXYF_01210 [Candidatus Woesearchaeota archaeon]